MSVKAALLAVLWPAAVSLVVLLIGLGLRRWRHAGHAAGAAALAAGFITTEVVVRGVPPLVPADGSRWLAHIALVLGALAILRAMGGRTLWMLAASGIAVGGGVAMLLGPSMRWNEGWVNPTATMLAAAAAVVLLHAGGRLAGRGSPGWLGPLLMMGVCLGGAVVLMQSYAASLAQLAAGLAAALGPVLLMALWWARMRAGAGALPMAAVLLALLVLAGRAYEGMTMGSALLLLGAGVVPGLLALPGLGLRAGARLGIGAGVVAALILGALWLSPAGLDFSM
jgi:hypothetical protein